MFISFFTFVQGTKIIQRAQTSILGLLVWAFLFLSCYVYVYVFLLVLHELYISCRTRHLGCGCGIKLPAQEQHDLSVKCESVSRATKHVECVT